MRLIDGLRRDACRRDALVSADDARWRHQRLAAGFIFDLAAECASKKAPYADVGDG